MITSFPVGDLRVTALTDGVGRVTPQQLYGGRVLPGADGATARGGDAADWAEHAQFLDAEGRLEMPLGVFVIETGSRVMLIDAGYGPTFPATVENGASLLANLSAAGFATGDVTDVVLSHLHVDHIGWTAVGGDAVFPAATYRCDVRDWQHFVARDDDATAPDHAYRSVAKGKLAPIAARFDPWSGDGPLAPGVDVLHAPGHTPGNTIVVLSDGAARVLLLGDVVHCPVQLLDDEWARIADVDEALARRTQARLAAELEGSSTRVVGAHFPGLQLGRVLRAEGRRNWVV